LQSIDIDFKRYLLTQLPTQPFISIGLSFPWLWVSDGSNVLDNSNNLIGINDETISGMGYKLGVGMEIYLDDHFSLIGMAQERWTEFNQVNGAFKVAENSFTFNGNSANVGSFAGNGLNFFVGTSIGFQ